MKKSFLKRVMAAAVAVPVALTQTMLCTSFAADADADAVADAAEKTAITVDTFMDVLADPTVNVPEEISTGYWIQDSTWEEKVATAVTDLYGTTCTLDAAKLADAIEGDADSVAGILKRVLMNEGVTATAVVGDNTVVITVDADYVPMAVTEKAAELGVTLDTAALAADAQVVITVNTAELASKKVSAAAVVTVDGQAVDAAGAFAYAYSKVAAVAAEAEKAGVADEFAPIVAEYKANLDKAQNALAKASAKTVNETYEAADVDALYEAITAKTDKELPATFDEAMANGTVLNVVNEVMAQLNAAIEDSAYTVSITVDDVTAEAHELSDITATVNVANGEGSADLSAEATDDITAEEYETLFNYFVEYEAAKGNAIVEGTFKTVKVVDVEASGTAAYFAGEAVLNVQREITYEAMPEEETTTTTATTDPSATESTTSGTETTDPADTETTTTGTETTDPADTETTTIGTETTDPAGTETTTSGTETTTTESETTTTSESSTDDTTTTTTSEVTVITVTAKNDAFYLSHDTSEITAEELIESIEITVRGTDGVNTWETPVEPDMSLVTFGLTDEGEDFNLTPYDVYDAYQEAYTACELYIYYDGELVDTTAYVYIGVKGDATLDGEANAKDSSNMLIYAANKAAGLEAALTDGSDGVLERFAYFLGDVNGESKDNGETATIEGGDAGLNAKDSSCTLIFAARVSAGLIDTSSPEGIAAGWAEIIG